MLDLLKEARVFKECTAQELQAVADISQRMTLESGQRIFEAGAPAEYLYIVTDGAVELRFRVTHYRASQEVTIDRIFKSGVFGWSALGESHAYTLSAMAVKDSELLRINPKDMKRLCTDNNHFGYLLMKNIAQIIGERFDLVQKILIDTIQQNLREKEL